MLLAGGIALGAISCGGSETSTSSTTSTSAPATAASTSEPPPVTTSPLVVIDYAGGATYVTGRIADFRIDQGTISTEADGNQHSPDGTIH